MAFAGGMTVFPGGAVAAGDQIHSRAWVGSTPKNWADRLGLSDELAGSLVGAAVRETFEECGVLLASTRTGRRALPDDRVRDRERAALISRSRTLAELFTEYDLILRADTLHAWARWVTPRTAPRRYDTAFFVARIPDGEYADARTTEAVEAAWWHPAEALERHRLGELKLMPPTLHNLRELAEHEHTESVLTAAPHRVIEPIEPTMRRNGDQVIVEHRGNPNLRFSFSPAEFAP